MHVTETGSDVKGKTVKKTVDLSKGGSKRSDVVCIEPKPYEVLSFLLIGRQLTALGTQC